MFFFIEKKKIQSNGCSRVTPVQRGVRLRWSSLNILASCASVRGNREHKQITVRNPFLVFLVEPSTVQTFGQKLVATVLSDTKGC